MNMNIGKTKGFSLIELIIAVAIIGILTTIAYPAYTDYVRQSKRSDARAALVSFANAMERQFTRNNTFAGLAVGDEDEGAPAPSVFPSRIPLTNTGATTYTLRIAAAGASTYTLEATSSFGDTDCSPLTIDESGNRGPAGCW
jgi:type IV pilus assembly protein PilE